MVTALVTGWPYDERRRVEIIKENFKTEVCFNMPEYPFGVDRAAGGTWKNGEVSLCGGYDGDSYVQQCYSLKNSEWTTIGTLQEGISGHGASNIGSSIWLTGGKGNYVYLASTEIINPDGKITPGPDLPQPRYGHCQISYGQSTFIIGKCIFSPKLWIKSQ